MILLLSSEFFQKFLDITSQVDLRTPLTKNLPEMPSSNVPWIPLENLPEKFPSECLPHVPFNTSFMARDNPAAGCKSIQ